MVEMIRKDSFVTAECKLLRPEALFSGTQENETKKVSCQLHCLVYIFDLVWLMF